MAAAFILVARPPAETPAPVAVDVTSQRPGLPLIVLDAGADDLVDPLSQELENLQADLRRAHDRVREDIGF